MDNMSHQAFPERVEPVENEKPDKVGDLAEAKSCETPGKENLMDKALKDQMTADPVGKGPFLSVDNSPVATQYVSVMKAKLREQESKYVLEMFRLKKEYEWKEESLKEELSALATSIAAIKKDLEVETKLKAEAVRRAEQSSKDLVIISGKCAELQGRLTENHAALKESRAHIESLFVIHQAKLAEIRRENSEAEGKLFDNRQALERKVRSLEKQLAATRAEFVRVINEKSEEWQEKEEELRNRLIEEKIASERLALQNADMSEELYYKKVELKGTLEGWEGAKAEVKDLMEFHSLELMNMREEHGKLKSRLEKERYENDQMHVAELKKIRDQAIEMKKAHDAFMEEDGIKMKKYEDEIMGLKEDFERLAERNKALISELKRLYNLIEEKEKLCGAVTARVEELELEVEKAELAKQGWLLEKSELVEEMVTKGQILMEIVSSKDAEISAIQKELNSVKTDFQEKLDVKKACITNLESSLADFKQGMEDGLRIKDDKIEELAKELEDERRKVASSEEELAIMKDSLKASNAQRDGLTLKCEESDQRVSELKIEISRLINEVADVKEENIDLKCGKNEALEKGDFYKDRNTAYAEQLAKLQREKADREVELIADIEEKKSLIEYLQGQVAASSANGNEKMKLEDFQTSGRSSPVKAESTEEEKTGSD